MNEGNASQKHICLQLWQKKQGRANKRQRKEKETNCVEGTSRIRLIEVMSKNGIELHTVQHKIESLLEADFCFTSNSFGLSILNKINNKKLLSSHPLFATINNKLFWFCQGNRVYAKLL